jgi:hypothetical protein
MQANDSSTRAQQRAKCRPDSKELNVMLTLPVVWYTRRFGSWYNSCFQVIGCNYTDRFLINFEINVYGLCPSSIFYIAFRKLELFLLTEAVHWLRLALSKGPNRVGATFFLPEVGNRSSLRNVVFLKKKNIGRWTKSINMFLSSEIHHR